jgi:ATP:corrinoid adenosyltransferase
VTEARLEELSAEGRARKKLEQTQARRRPGNVHVVITGRGAPPELIEFADLVTEMRAVKHPYRDGVKAQKGIEF